MTSRHRSRRRASSTSGACFVVVMKRRWTLLLGVYIGATPLGIPIIHLITKSPLTLQAFLHSLLITSKSKHKWSLWMVCADHKQMRATSPLSGIFHFLNIKSRRWSKIMPSFGYRIVIQKETTAILGATAQQCYSIVLSHEEGAQSSS